MSEETNKRRVREFFEEVWNQATVRAADDYIAADAIGHNPDFGTSLEAFKAQWNKMLEAFPDLHIDLEDIVAEEDKVATRWTLTGTHKGVYEGLSPTGKRVKVTGMSFDRLVDGQIMEGWDNWDGLGLLEQLGAQVLRSPQGR